MLVIRVCRKKQNARHSKNGIGFKALEGANTLMPILGVLSQNPQIDIVYWHGHGFYFDISHPSSPLLSFCIQSGATYSSDENDRR